MQKRHSFLLMIAVYCLLVIVLTVSARLPEAETMTVSVVYAQRKQSLEVKNAEETADNAQTPLVNDNIIQKNNNQVNKEENEMDNMIHESGKAMQHQLAEDIAKEENERLLRIEKKKKKEQEKEKQRLLRESRKVHLSEKETSILYRIVEAETGGEDIESRILVTHAILNRVESDDFPNTVEQVVFEKNQFSPTFDGRYYSVTVSKETKDAVNRVLDGEEDRSNGATYFMARAHSASKNVRWFDHNLTKVAVHGTIEFFK